MNKLFKVGALLVVVALIVGVFGVLAVFAGEDDAALGRMGWAQRASGVFHEERQAAMADALGVTVEDLAEARAAARGPIRLNVEDGANPQQIHAALAEARGVAQANGETGQAGCCGNQYRRGPQQEPLGLIDREMMHAALAALLGMTVEQFEAARAAGTPLAVLAEQQGVELETLRQVMHDVREQAIEQALAEGTITADQAEWLLSRPGPGGFQNGAGGTGPGAGMGPGPGRHGAGQGRGMGNGSSN